MLNSARQWVELGQSVPDACANIVKNPRRPVARYLNREEFNRLGAALDRHEEDHPWPVAAIRLLTLTGRAFPKSSTCGGAKSESCPRTVQPPG